MTISLFPWQIEAWRQLQAIRPRLPHALLFHGPAGIGKTLFAERFAQALLCQAPTADGEACGRCASCGWFAQYSHPDYRRVRPEALEQDGGEPAESDGDGTKAGKAARAPSKEIRIDQIRALADFMNVSTHRQGMRVVLLYPAEALNSAAANALLKTLEEPPPATVFLLVADSLDRLLPTILSRCRQFALSLPARQQALDWLTQQGVADADVWLAEQGGAPLHAQALAQAGNPEAMQALLQMLAGPGHEAALKTAERLQKAPVADLVAWLQRWLYDLFSLKLSGRIRYYPRYRKELAALAAHADAAGLLGAIRRLNERRAVAEHPLAARLFIEDMLLDYAGLFSGRQSASRGA
jgi:DNA polymerase-3 subunit delta'